MKKILIPTLLILIISCQKNNSNKTPARSYTDSIMELTEKISKTDTVTLTEKEKNNDKIAEFKNESKLKNLSEKDFNFIIDKLLEDGFGLTGYTYLDFGKIDNEYWNSEITSGPINKMDERVKNKNFFVFEFNYGTNASLRQEYFLLDNNEMKYIDFKLDKADETKLHSLLEKVGGKDCFLLTGKLAEIIKDKQNNYELTFGLQKSSDSDNYPSASIKYKTKDFKSIIPNSIMKFDDTKNKYVELK
jgi:hypothetical protein